MRKAINFRIICQALMFLALGIAAMTYANKAHAKEVAYMPNEAGGEIILTDQRGKCPAGQRIVLGRGASGRMIHGCYTFSTSGRFVLVNWADGDASMYDVSDFKLYADTTENFTYE